MRPTISVRDNEVTLDMDHVKGPVVIERINGKVVLSGNMSADPPYTASELESILYEPPIT